MYELVFGLSVRVFFLFGVFVVFYLMYFVVNVLYVCVFLDVLYFMGIVKEMKLCMFVCVFSGVFLLFCFFIYVVIFKLMEFVLLSGLM